MFMDYPLENWLGVVKWFIGIIIIFTTTYFVSELLTDLFFTENKEPVNKRNHKKKIFHDVA